jgi:hypothetical protein
MQFPTISIKKSLSLVSLTMLSFCGCRDTPSKTTTESEKWNMLSIGFKNCEIIVLNHDNTARLRKILSYRKSIEKYSTTYTPDKFDETSIKITSEDKDSIYKWTKKLISKPFIPKAFCTDYVGKLFLIIEVNEQVTYYCKYNSICEWSKMNIETLKLHKLLNTKFKLE